MTDTYLSIAAIAGDYSMQIRVTACAAQQGEESPEPWTLEHRYNWAAAPGWAAAWDSALAAGNPNPGAAPDVITDGMILTQVQAMLGTP